MSCANCTLRRMDRRPRFVCDSTCRVFLQQTRRTSSRSEGRRAMRGGSGGWRGVPAISRFHRQANVNFLVKILSCSTALLRVSISLGDPRKTKVIWAHLGQIEPFWRGFTRGCFSAKSTLYHGKGRKKIIIM